jgi:lipoprotein LprG
MSILSARPVALMLSAVLLLAGTGCSGSGGDKPSGDTPKAVLAHAKELLDKTSGVELSISSTGLPEKSSGALLVGGTGTAIHPSSFEGSLNLKAFGFTDDAEVIATDGKVWIKLSLLGPGFTEVDPARYGVPDPSSLLAAHGGVSDLLVETTGLKEGESVRGGADNKEVLTQYSGSLTAKQVQLLVPSASDGEFSALYEITSDGHLHSVELTGPFYAGERNVTYTIDFEKYDVEKKISAP